MPRCISKETKTKKTNKQTGTTTDKRIYFLYVPSVLFYELFPHECAFQRKSCLTQHHKLIVLTIAHKEHNVVLCSKGITMHNWTYKESVKTCIATISHSKQKTERRR